MYLKKIVDEQYVRDQKLVKDEAEAILPTTILDYFAFHNIDFEQILCVRPWSKYLIKLL